MERLIGISLTGIADIAVLRVVRLNSGSMVNVPMEQERSRTPLLESRFWCRNRGGISGLCVLSALEEMARLGKERIKSPPALLESTSKHVTGKLRIDGGKTFSPYVSFSAVVLR